MKGHLLVTFSASFEAKWQLHVIFKVECFNTDSLTVHFVFLAPFHEVSSSFD